jgi:hypothetical protein
MGGRFEVCLLPVSSFGVCAVRSGVARGFLLGHEVPGFRCTPAARMQRDLSGPGDSP